MIIIASGVEVDLLHQGFDIVIVQYSDGKQEILKPEEIGLKRRERPKRFKHS
jgi:hypothetical protein